MNTENIKGIIVPIITPVDQDENIDEQKLREQVDRVIDGGVSGILAFGSNGEFYMFDYEETKFGLEIIVDQTKKRVPVFLGIGDIPTKRCVRLAKMAQKVGADGISILQPMFLKPTEEELYAHIKTIADAVPNLPVLLYNNPGRTGYNMSVNLVNRLAHEVENIVGMKDSSGDMTLLSEYIRVTRDVDFKVMSGKDTLLFAGLCVGTVGGVCSIANVIPELICGIYDKFVAGDFEGAREDQFRLNPIRLSQDLASFPVATKDMCNMLGMEVGKPVRPSLPSTGNVYEAMYKELDKAGFIKD